MEKISFSNWGRSPARIGETASEKEFRELVSDRFSEQALEVSEDLRKMFRENIDKVAPGYFGSYIFDLMTRVPRYAYIKGRDSDGSYDETSEVCVDLVNHTYWTVKSTEEDEK